MHPFSYPKSHHELYRGICLLSISPVIGFLWQVFLAPWSLIHMPCCSSYWGLELGEFSEGLPRSRQEAAEEESNTWEALTRPCYAQGKCDNIGSEFQLPTRFGCAHLRVLSAQSWSQLRCLCPGSTGCPEEGTRKVPTLLSCLGGFSLQMPARILLHSSVYDVSTTRLKRFRL